MVFNGRAFLKVKDENLRYALYKKFENLYGDNNLFKIFGYSNHHFDEYLIVDNGSVRVTTWGALRICKDNTNQFIDCDEVFPRSEELAWQLFNVIGEMRSDTTEGQYVSYIDTMGNVCYGKDPNKKCCILNSIELIDQYKLVGLIKNNKIRL